MYFLKRWFYRRFNSEEWSRFNWDLDKNLPIYETTFVVFDTETTGLDLKRDEPIAIGAFKIKNCRLDLGSRFYELMKPSKGLSTSIKVHGITPKELEGVRPKSEVCLDFINYAKGCILCGFFVHIDLVMLQRVIKEEFGAAFCPPIVDIFDLLEEKDRSGNLESIIKRFGLPTSLHHNALEDAYMSGMLFLKLIKEGGFRKVKDLPLR
ncbi:MAG: 3'-5' exonuclease [Caldimicrobium sp.]|nr:3'-5' exonuclease [Caldimicrobium sp.]MCX7613759.1 3'-5' exonuclease [Caldimicrobium sp.]MDW8182586.1 3'-5' exonuclease [Caldimicrobium sp.]